MVDDERDAAHHGRGVGGDGHLVRLGNCTHTPYLAHHYRRKLVGSLPWGIPMVVVYRQTGAEATNLMVTQDTDKDFIQVRPPCGRNTYVLRLIVLLHVEFNCCCCCVPLGDLCPSLYILKGQSYKQNILFGTISCSLAVHAD